jgi:hypothetical protein
VPASHLRLVDGQSFSGALNALGRSPNRLQRRLPFAPPQLSGASRNVGALPAAAGVQVCAREGGELRQRQHLAAQTGQSPLRLVKSLSEGGGKRYKEIGG